MQFQKAILCHAILLSIQPLYFVLRWTINPNYFGSASPVWLTVAAVCWIYFLTQITIPCFTSPLRHLPSPSSERFPYGHFHFFRELPPTERILRACEETPNDGLIAFWDLLYLRIRFIPTSPEAVMDILNTHNYDWEKPLPAKRLLSRILGDGLIIVEGNTHKAMRRSVAPAFSGRVIRDLVPLFWSKGLAFADSMAREAEASADGAVEMMSQMSRVTLDIIGAAGIGMDFDTINSDDNKLAKLYATITSTNRGPVVPFFLTNLLLPPRYAKRLYGTRVAEIANATEELRQSIRELLTEKKQAVKLNTAEKDIIATIMRSGEFSDDYLCDQLLTFLAAGHDTTASALTWTTWLLATNPEKQDRLRAECKQHLTNKSLEDINADTFESMPYLTAVCNETLRLYPTVPVTARHAVTNTRVGNTPIRKGTNVVIPIWAINRSTSLWGPDADSFNPDRWLDGPFATTGGAKSLHAQITFLHGPRSCIGQSFARTEMKCLLAALVLRFRFEFPEDSPPVKVGGFFTIKPKGGLRVKLHDLSVKT